MGQKSPMFLLVQWEERGFGLEYLFFEIRLLHREKEFFVVGMGPLRWEYKRRRNRARRRWVLRHKRRELQHFANHSFFCLNS